MLSIRKEEELLRVIYEDDALLVVNKPAGLVCHPTKTDCLSSLVARLRIYQGYCPLRMGPGDCIYCPDGTCPWDVEETDTVPPVNLINRLDRETSGVVLTTKNYAAARVMGKLMRDGKIKKTYQAIVKGVPEPAAGLIDQPLGDDEQSPVIVKDCVRPDGTPARTAYRLIRSFERDGVTYSLLDVFPDTGRKHQIRIHLAWIGCPVVGDKLYGEDERYYLDLVEGRLTEEQRRRLILPWHALHARSLTYTTWDGQTRSFECEPEPWFREFAGM